MEEVTIRLRLTRPALGYAQRRTKSDNVMYVMPRDPLKRVIFLRSWWGDRLDYAARVLNRYGNLATRVVWDQVVEGELGQHWRPVTRIRNGVVIKCGYALHEAFRAGAEIVVHAILPSGLTIPALRELLEIIGRYKGISPYCCETEAYGTFEILTIQPKVRLPAEATLEEGLCNLSSAAAEPSST